MPLEHPRFSPIALDLGFVQIHWYGITYLVAFALFYWLASLRVKQEPFAGRGWTRRDVEDLLFFGIVGVILGGRLGYVLFYKFRHYLEHPLEIIAVWKGGMSFHGGLLGVIAAMALFAYLRKRKFFEVTDLIAPCVPTGLASGRIGNFINGELWGRAADPSLPWAMVFPQSGTPTPRHPSPLYQFAMEGLLLFALLWWYSRRPSVHAAPAGGIAWGRVSGAFLVGYGVLRFVAEYFREPDSFLGLLALNLSMGQWLCVPMVLVGLAFWTLAGRWPPGRVPPQ
jgi:phosphatidylglycerol:prolipoprotein diacylglycerol transferase